MERKTGKGPLPPRREGVSSADRPCLPQLKASTESHFS